MLGILMLVLVTKAILLPISIRNSKIQKKMNEISEELQDIKKNIKEKKEQAEKTLKVYKKAGINPFSPIAFLLIQIPFFISIFFVTRDIGDGLFKYEEALYSFVTKPEFIDFTFFSMYTAEKGGLIIALFITLSQLILMQQMQKKGAKKQKNTKIITAIMPIIIGALSLTIVATVGIYWLFNNLISIVQEIFIKNAKKEEVPKEEESESSTELQHPEG